MKANDTKFNVKDKVKLKFKRNNEDFDMNGIIATVTHPFAFGCMKENWVGLWFDEDTKYGENMNVHINDIVKVED